jgi:hypothetical protein
LLCCCMSVCIQACNRHSTTWRLVLSGSRAGCAVHICAVFVLSHVYVMYVSVGQVDAQIWPLRVAAWWLHVNQKPAYMPRFYDETRSFGCGPMKPLCICAADSLQKLNPAALFTAMIAAMKSNDIRKALDVSRPGQGPGSNNQWVALKGQSTVDYCLYGGAGWVAHDPWLIPSFVMIKCCAVLHDGVCRYT